MASPSKENSTPIQSELVALAREFKDSARLEFPNGSPLYEQLCIGIAKDQEILRLAWRGRRNPKALLFLGAVHFLLLEGAQHQLRDFYASLAEAPRSPEGAYPHFRQFCLAHREEIVELVTTRVVQTNEVQRCTSLLPAFAKASQWAQGASKPLALVEVGAGAGLNLLWDRYGYSYDHMNDMHPSGHASQRRTGNPDSPVQLTCRVRGEKEPTLPASMPAIASRIGVDLNPIDVHDQREVLWLRALVWPEQKYRAELLGRAVQFAWANPVTLIRGDALDLLPGIIAGIPYDVVPCIYHSYTLNQFSIEERERFSHLLHRFAGGREQLFYISLEGIQGLRGNYPQLELTRFEIGAEYHQQLAYCHPHGAWIEWLAA